MEGTLNRRTALAVAAAALASVHRAWGKSHITRARVTAITDETGATQSDAVAFAKQFGLSLVELRNVPETKKEFALLTEPELRRYASELATSKIRVSLLKTSLLKFAWPGMAPADAALQPDEKRWARRKSDFTSAIAAAGVLGCDRIRVFTGARTANPAAVLPEVARAIGEFIPMAEAAKVRLVIENEPSQNIGTAAEIKALMDLLPSPAIGFDWDPWNSLALGEAPFPDGYAHLPKNRMMGVTVKGESMSGKDPLNWRSLLDALQKDNYAGPVSLATERFEGDFVKQAGDMMGDLLHVVSRLD